MKTKLNIIIILLFTASNAHSKVNTMITSADTNDYVNCAAFYSSTASSIKVLGANAKQINYYKERAGFFLKTAIIYNTPTMTTSQIKSKFLIQNKEHTSTAYKMLNNSNKETYPAHIDSYISKCKDMLNINMLLLIEKQKIKIK